MNIFFLDRDPVACAQAHGDKHVVKMILETAQLLCGVYWATGSTAPYKATHLNHPCARWVRDDYFHYNWLMTLGFALCDEYTHRYGKIHKTKQILEWCSDNIPNIKLSRWQNPPLAMPDQYKTGDIVESYRNYYREAKKNLHVYTNRERPVWL